MKGKEKKRILVADKNILPLATLIGTLKDSYHIVTAKNAADVIKQSQKNKIDMFLLDTYFEDTDGFDLCARLQQKNTTRDIPVIFITADNSVNSEEKGFNAGAVDYITKPFNAPTVLARIKNQFKSSDAIKELKRLNQLALDANPNTGLPGNNSIRYELERIIKDKRSDCVIYADLDHFKIYNDTYGFSKGDDVIIFTANVIRVALEANGCTDAFLGHIGGDDFVFIIPSEKCSAVSEEIIQRMNHGITEFYTAEDADRGYVLALNREGEEKHHPLVSLSMGAIDLSQRKVSSVFEIIDICTETKRAAKRQVGSNILLCKRQWR